VPYPRIGESPSLRMRLGKVPWMKLVVVAVGAWAVKTRWWDQPDGWVKVWLGGFWAERVRLGWR